jgi:putative hydrolase of the HAD superfamily
MPAIKAVLFDLDDTLWPVVPVIMRAETMLFEWLSRHAPLVTLRHSIESLRQERKLLMASNPKYALDLEALRRDALIKAFEDVGEDPAKVEHAMSIFIQARNAVTFFDDVLPSLDRLKDRFVLGSITNGTADLDSVGLSSYFQLSMAARVFGTAKPSPAIFHAACDALGISPHEAVYVGDDPILDVTGAQNAGLHSIWINRSGVEPNHVLPDGVHPHAICTTLLEFEEWLNEHAIISSNPMPPLE